jgi:hypothetical protein
MKNLALPICPVHKIEMAPATRWVKRDNHPFPVPIHVCTKPHCLYVFDSEGYRQEQENAVIGQPLSIVIPHLQKRKH